MSKITYTSSWSSGSDFCENSVDSWIFNAIVKDGIESSIKRSAELLSLIAAEWLEKHPEMLHDVAYAIGCSGYDHKLIKE